MNFLGQFQTWARDLAALSERLRETGAIQDSAELDEQVHCYQETLRTAWATERLPKPASISCGLSRRSIDLLEHGCMETSAHGMIERANQAAAKLLNFPLPLLTGQPLLVFVAEDDRRVFLSQFMALRRSYEARHQWLVRCQPLFDPPYLASVTAQRVAGPDGRTLGIIWLLARHQS